MPDERGPLPGERGPVPGERGPVPGGRSAIARPPLPGGPYLVVGLERSGMAAASALRRLGERVIGVDAGAPSGLERLRAEGVEAYGESDGLAQLTKVQAVVKSPEAPSGAPAIVGAPAILGAPAIVGAHAQGLPVLGELELGWRLLPNETIAVTGTNGKTTTVELIAHIHAQAGLPIAAASDIGLAFSSLAGRIDAAVTVVVEASSVQLEDTVAFLPEIAVLLNLAPHHLDRHGGFDEYVAAKLRAFARQREQDVAVLPADPEGVGVDRAGAPISCASIEERIRRLGGEGRVVCFGAGESAEMRLREGALWWRGERLIDAAELCMVGAHNVRNAMAAAAACLEAGVQMEAVRAGLRSFPGVKHTLERVALKHGVAYVNDSRATSMAGTIVALQALAGSRPIHLITGGQSDGQDFSALRAPVRAACAGVYLIGEDLTKIEQALEGVDVPVARCGRLEVALERACVAARRAIASARWVDAARRGAGLGAARRGSRVAGRGPRAARGGSRTRETSPAPQGEQAEQIVLFAPGGASLDQLTDFQAQGDRFQELVEEL